jgi:hypothetical protein
MKKLIGSKNSLYTGIAFLFAFLSITTSCSKTMNDMGNTTGTGGTVR